MGKRNIEVEGFSLWKLSWPLWIQLILVYAIMLTDSFFLSKFSDDYAASIGAIFPIYAIFYMLFNQMGQAGCSVASQYMGAKKNEQIISTYMTSVFIMLITGIIASAFMFTFSRDIGTWVGLTPQNNEITRIYISFTGTSLVLESLKSAYNGILSSKGKTFWNMIVSILYNITNILINVLFLTGFLGVPKLGVSGVAISTVISELIALATLMFIVHVKEQIKFSFKDFTSKFKYLWKQVVKIGIPSSLEPISVQLVGYVVTLIVVGLGMNALAAKTYTFNLMSLITAWSVGIGVGTAIIVAHSVGAKKYEGADKQLHKSIVFSSGICFLMVLVFLICSSLIFRLFTENKEIINLGIKLLIISLFWEPIRAINIITAYSLSAAGDARFCAISGTIIMWIVGLPLCYLISITLGFGLIGIWFALFLDEVIRGIVYYFRWRKKRWQKMGITENKQNMAITEK